MQHNGTLAKSRKDSGKVCDEEYKMIRQTKVTLVGSIIAVVGLYGSIAHATSAANKQNAFAKSDIEIQLNSVLNSAANSYAQPMLTFAVFHKNNYIDISSFSTTPRQPLPGIRVADFSTLVPNNLKKKNSVFEFAAKFNDKLQQILAYFDFSSTTRSSNKNISEKKQDTKSNFMAKINKKPLKSRCNTSKS